MESSGESNKVHISGYAAKKLKNLGYKVVYRGLVVVKVTVTFSKFESECLIFFFYKKGKGEMETFWLEEGPDDNTSHRRRNNSASNIY